MKKTTNAGAIEGRGFLRPVQRWRIILARGIAKESMEFVFFRSHN